LIDSPSSRRAVAIANAGLYSIWTFM
jgi:hypothetical protein